MLCVRGSVGRSLASAKRFAAKCQWPETPPKSKQKCSGIRERRLTWVQTAHAYLKRKSCLSRPKL